MMEVQVVEGDIMPVVGLKTATELNLVKRLFTVVRVMKILNLKYSRDTKVRSTGLVLSLVNMRSRWMQVSLR